MDDPPKLKGRAVEVKHFGRPLLKYFLTVMDAEDTQHVQIKIGLESSIAMEQVLDDTRGLYKMPPDDAEKFEEHTLTYIAMMNSLEIAFEDDGRKLFHRTIKGHYLLHVAALAKFFHPALGWCYSGEDMMQKVRTLVASTVKAVPYFMVCSRVLKKYAKGIFHRLNNVVAWRG